MDFSSSSSRPFPVRGYMLDVSRDKVPTMATLRGRVELLSRLGYNQFQLYMEHTFAYAGHEAVWREASPLTAAEIRELDALCAARGIELVPNQNSFGHMERWLRHDAYAALAEDPERRLTLCPIDPGAIELMRDLYAQLLPHFTSRQFNIGCDETWELGEGRSRAACEQRGKGRVYLDYLLALFELVRAHGRRPMFWGDIILQHPELIDELPRDIVALQWGYRADQPEPDHTRRLAAAGVPFVVCPGTNGWNSIAGRVEDLLPNLANAVHLARAHGAEGLLMTDWGDNGHWQPWAVSLPGLVGGALAATRGRPPTAAEIAATLNEVLGDASGRAGPALLELGLAQSAAGVGLSNRSFGQILLQQPAEPLPEGLTAKGLAAVERRLDAALELWGRAFGGAPPDATLDAEIRHAAALVRHACRLGRARLAANGAPAAALAPATRRALGEQLAPLIDEQRRLWLARNRPGGLADSLGRFAPLRAAYLGH